MRLFRGRRRDDDLVDEIETHLSLLEAQYRKSGLSASDARDAAQRSFGGVLKTRQAFLEQERWHGLANLAHDARSAWRSMVRERRSSLGPILVIGLGIAANTLVFTLGYSHTLRGLPIADAERVLMASFTEAGAERQLAWVEYERLRSQVTLLSSVAAFGATVPVSVGDNGRAPDRYQATYVSSNAFDAIAVRPVIGRMFTPAEDRPGGARVAVLGAELFRTRYAGDLSIVGRDVLINGRPTTVVGILPDAPGLPSAAEVWLPASHAADFAPTDPAVRTVRAFGPVRRDTPIASAKAELETLLAAAAAQVPGSRLQPLVSPIDARFFGSPTDGVWLAFFSAGILVLVVSSANVANMMLARGTARAREMAIRGSIGASRGRLFTQLIVESVAIATAGAAVGFPIARAGIAAFSAQIPAGVLPYWIHYSMDARLFGLLVLIAFAAALVFGLLPSLQASRVDVVRVLRDGGWGGSGRSSSRHWTTAFVAVQMGLAVVLLAYGVTNSLGGEDPPPSDAALRSPDVLTASLALAGERYRTAPQRAEIYRHVADRVCSAPGVSSVALAGVIPRAGAGQARLQLMPAAVAPSELPGVATLSVGPAYFSTLRVAVLQGREFADGDELGEAAALVNQRFVTTFLAAEAPLDRRITLVNPTTKTARTFRIVGVVEDVVHRSSVEPVVYQPIALMAPTTVFLLVRNQLDAATMTAQLRTTILGLDPDLPVFNALTLQRAVYDAGWNPRLSVRLINVLTLIAVLLVGVGLSSTAAQAVYQRTKEIGIRSAMGARPSQIGGLVLTRTAPHVMLGLLLGALCTFAWDAAFFSGSSNDRFTDPQTLATIAAILLSIVAAAWVVPLRRAIRLDPVIALRQD